MAKPKAKNPAAAKTSGPAGDAPTTKPQSKAETIIKLLSREDGATVEQMSHATGWQKHSVRGFIAGWLQEAAGARRRVG